MLGLYSETSADNTEQILAEVHKIKVEERRLFDNFEKQYHAREFAKASEFLWGSISKIAFAIGLLFGKKLGKHRQNVLLMRDLAKGDPKIIDWINAAESLHSNFYHNWMGEETFEDYVRKVIDLRIWLLKILDEMKGRMYARV